MDPCFASGTHHHPSLAPSRRLHAGIEHSPSSASVAAAAGDICDVDGVPTMTTRCTCGGYALRAVRSGRKDPDRVHPSFSSVEVPLLSDEAVPGRDVGQQLNC